MEKVVVIGSGIAGLSTACYLSKAGKEVTVLEKLDQPGGRARQLKADGFTFDLGPSWYWMPDVFERFFAHFAKSTGDYYALQRLSPSYDVYWDNKKWSLPSNYASLRTFFESIEPGSALQLDKYLCDAQEKYRLGLQRLAYKPANSLLEFVNWESLRALVRLDLFTSTTKHINRYFQHPELRLLLSFPSLFLGALASEIPALYSMMNYADIKLGTWYPSGGIYSIVQAMHELATGLGVKFRFNEEVESVTIIKNKINSVVTRNDRYMTEAVIGAADYHHIDQVLLPPEYRSYDEAYWNSRVMAPSCIIFYVGLNKKVPSLQHHSLFFDVPFDHHADQIYKQPSWPDQPLFYVCCSSRTDHTVAPPDCEGLFILLPVAAGLKGDDEATRDFYFQLVMKRLEERLNEELRPHVIYMKSYAGSNFLQDYNAFKGNAYGLANTLRQTAILKPGVRSKKIKNLFYTGQLTVPGPGMPPAIISGEIAAKEAICFLKKTNQVF